MKPLAGRRILVTRAPHQAPQLAETLREMGALPILIPTIEIVPPASYAALDAALGSLAGFDLVAFTSANAVQAYGERMQSIGLVATPRRIAAVGPATARALEAIGLHAEVIPPVYTAESLAQSLLPEARDRNILLILAEGASQTLGNALEAAGARTTIASAYANRIPEDSRTAITALFASPATYPEAIIFTSASTVHNLVALLEAAGLGTHLPASIVRASIGPITSRALRELGLPPHCEAAEPTIPALAAALIVHFNAP